MSHRGATSLFADILTYSIPEKQSKGKIESLNVIERNDCIVHRYWYYLTTTGFRYDLLVKIVAQQFFLSERTIQDILFFDKEKLKNVRKEQPGKKALERKWPHLNWEQPDLSDYL